MNKGCIVCGAKPKLTRPCQTIVYGTVQRVAYFDVCLPCWKQHRSRITVRSRRAHDQAMERMNTGLRIE